MTRSARDMEGLPRISDAEQRIIIVMPLHAITATYGEQGLRTGLANEIAQFDDAGSQRLIRDALQLTAQLHAADRRQREPYLNHLLRVALRIICHYQVRDTDIVCAALLHDAVEDHADGLADNGRQGAFAVLAGSFGSEVASASLAAGGTCNTGLTSRAASLSCPGHG